MNYKTLIALSSLMLVSCVGPVHGPDKQFEGELQGAVTGAGAGAVTGFQVGAGTGPGALVGAGVGAVAGGIQGFGKDQLEEDLLALSANTREEREIAVAHEILQDHYKRRMELHPTRDIYPADLFFLGDEVRLCPSGKLLVKEIAKMNKMRAPWSRLVVAVYTKATDEESEFAQHLVERRSREISDLLVQGGLEPRRIETRGVIMTEPILIDPNDNPARYNQAVELIPLDR